MVSVFLRIFQTVLGVLGIAGNSIVCVVIYKVHSMHTLTNAFIFNQAAVDFLASAVFLLSVNIPIPVTYPPGPAGVLLCRIWTSKFTLWICLCTSSFNLMALTLERYYAIVFPFRYQAKFGRVQATVVIVCVWVCGSIFGTYAVIPFVNQGNKCIFYLTSEAQIFGVLVCVPQFVIPLAVMLAAYIHIAVTLKRSAGNIAPQPQPRAADDFNTAGQPLPESQDGSLMKARRNTFKTLLIVFVAYVVCWLPSEIAFFLFNFGVFISPEGTQLYAVSLAFAVANSCINPIIYALKYRSFQEGLRKVFGRRQQRDEPGTYGAP